MSTELETKTRAPSAPPRRRLGDVRGLMGINLPDATKVCKKCIEIAKPSKSQ